MSTTVSAWTAAELATEIAATKTAIGSARSGKSYQFSGRGLVRQDLKSLTDYLAYLVNEQNRLSRGGMRVRRVVTKP